MDEKAWAIIKAIITKGNDAVVRKKGDGYIVLEDKREIKFQARKKGISQLIFHEIFLCHSAQEPCFHQSAEKLHTHIWMGRAIAREIRCNQRT